MLACVSPSHQSDWPSPSSASGSFGGGGERLLVEVAGGGPVGAGEGGAGLYEPLVACRHGVHAPIFSPGRSAIATMS